MRIQYPPSSSSHSRINLAILCSAVSLALCSSNSLSSSLSNTTSPFFGFFFFCGIASLLVGGSDRIVSKGAIDFLTSPATRGLVNPLRVFRATGHDQKRRNYQQKFHYKLKDYSRFPQNRIFSFEERMELLVLDAPVEGV